MKEIFMQSLLAILNSTISLVASNKGKHTGGFQ